MIAGNLPLTAGLSAMASRLHVDHDLTPFAMREQAFNDMMKAAVANDDGAWEEAKARFGALRPNVSAAL